MIINNKAVSLSEAATMLGKSEQEVLRLSQYGYLEQVSLKAVSHEQLWAVFRSTPIEAG